MSDKEIKQWQDEVAEYHDLWCENVVKIRAEAVEDFANALLARAKKDSSGDWVVKALDITELVNEMAEDCNG